MDFFSWHCYANRPEEINAFALFVQNLLQKHGYEGIESILTEYNTMESLKYPPSTLPHYAAEIGAGLITAQNSPIDALMYYDMRVMSMNGIYYRNKYYQIERLHGFYAMKFFGNLFKLENQIELVCDYQGIYALAASDGKDFGIMLAVRDCSGKIEIEMSNSDKNTVVVTESSYENPIVETELKVADGRLSLTVQKDTLYYIKG